jgi:hypothetical protein|tara:strand:- start:585 stop:1106 length:522 start_codon:yes stop_codon:yes gene_type:complete
MKVKIGNYPTYRWYSKYIALVFGEKEQKVSVKLDRWDTWSMDATLAHIVVPMLIQLKKTTHGCPIVAFEDRPPELIGTIPKEPHITDEFWEESWNWALDEMLFAFKSKSEDWEGQFFTGESDWVFEKSENGNTYMTEGRNHNLTMDTEGMKMYQARITNGFRLFGKYYENLWD